MDKEAKKDKSMSFLYEVSLTPLKCAEKIERNQPVQENFFKIFSFLLKKLLFLLNKTDGIHFFLDKESRTVNYIYVSNTSTDDLKTLKYIPKVIENVSNYLKDMGVVSEGENLETPSKIFELKNITMEIFLKQIDDRLAHSFHEKSAKGALSIPFTGNVQDLGHFLIWGERNNKKKFIPSGKDMEPWISSWYKSLSSLIIREFNVLRNTYLPYHYTVGWKKVAVLFSDIRNFTPFTEILRDRFLKDEEKSNILGNMMSEFCREMCNIVHQNTRGRIDKFLGDGMMVIFGEYEIDPSRVVCEAILVATEMVKAFEKFKEDWQRQALSGGYDTEFNESVEIDFGIGIDYGSVYFDIIGDSGFREYGAMGDHVNFASRLQGMASKENERINKKMPHIIISSTAYRCCKPWLKEPKELTLDFKGKSHHYKCYGIEPEQFDLALYHTSHSCGNWKSAWEKGDMEPPYNSEKPWYKNL